ncbi:PREDICTED: uncharacterized protein LOC102250218 [Myotis brandtii]|uniref:uncharacterized protein LOC102250218 n=1 Tax=Myotis brandtii TaxID=109478 RepID=UPI000703F3FC|nr:PREDICTED: uncharacterized protein LOC102250218 [Myotis brandtii]
MSEYLTGTSKTTTLAQPRYMLNRSRLKHGPDMKIFLLHSKPHEDLKSFSSFTTFDPTNHHPVPQPMAPPFQQPEKAAHKAVNYEKLAEITQDKHENPAVFQSCLTQAMRKYTNLDPMSPEGLLHSEHPVELTPPTSPNLQAREKNDLSMMLGSSWIKKEDISRLTARSQGGQLPVGYRGSGSRRPCSESCSRLCRRFNTRARHLWPFSRRSPQSSAQENRPELTDGVLNSMPLQEGQIPDISSSLKHRRRVSIGAQLTQTPEPQGVNGTWVPEGTLLLP